MWIFEIGLLLPIVSLVGMVVCLTIIFWVLLDELTDHKSSEWARRYLKWIHECQAVAKVVAAGLTVILLIPTAIAFVFSGLIFLMLLAIIANAGLAWVCSIMVAKWLGRKSRTMLGKNQLICASL
ncbi:MAG: hypothetical protein A2751_05420 [Candidatus Doudnabacteria bacterium RIFCSPHIGHO2_01_FULL_46_14]|uniref:Uncharacterized protein n=1 Tax=Candidatus Doudnabacteria bacterium RIFCSPHIGHO2_01_FULL_46_14 TaxID=1817824 RepID=A0A1F5NPI1_9BACT|nr:MAG: hypothetical protein A2751_05420 [Candidatus Doudnabacteria bacterium RIFCSPHIGHO2_01_FULL_46_14]